MSRLLDVARRYPGRCAFAVFFGLTMLWSVITPLYGAPDEPAHVIRAESVVRGEILGTKVAGTGDLQVTVPAFLTQTGRDACFAFHATVPANCMHLDANGSGTRKLLTSAGRAPPLYYAIVGLPSLIAPNLTGVWLMRILSALLCAVLVALAVDTGRRYLTGTLAMFGIAVAITPMLFFLAGVVNPSAIEIAAAIAVWIAASRSLPRPHRRRIRAPRSARGRGRRPRRLPAVRTDLGAPDRCGAARGGRADGRPATVAPAEGPRLAGRARRTRRRPDGLELRDRCPQHREHEHDRDDPRVPRPRPRFVRHHLLPVPRDDRPVRLAGHPRTRPHLLPVDAGARRCPPRPLPARTPPARCWPRRCSPSPSWSCPSCSRCLRHPTTDSSGRAVTPCPSPSDSRSSPARSFDPAPAGSSAVLPRLTAGLLGLGLLLAFLEFWRRNAVGTHGFIFFLSNPAWRPALPGWFVLPAAVSLTGLWVWLILVAPIEHGEAGSEPTAREPTSNATRTT